MEERILKIKELLEKGSKFAEIKADKEVESWGLTDKAIRELIKKVQDEALKEPKTKPAEKVEIPTIELAKIQCDALEQSIQKLIREAYDKKLGLSSLKAAGQHIKTARKIIGRHA